MEGFLPISRNFHHSATAHSMLLNIERASKAQKTNGFWVQKEIKWLICYHTSPMTSVIRILTENTISEFPDVAFFQKNLLWDLLGKVL